MHILYFIRHGQYDDKDTRTDCTGKELLSKGKQQAELTGSWLAEKELALTLGDLSFDLPYICLITRHPR